MLYQTFNESTKSKGLLHSDVTSYRKQISYRQHINLIESLKEIGNAILDKLTGTFKNLGSQIVGIANQVETNVISLANQIEKDALYFSNEVGNGVVNIGSNIGSGLNDIANNTILGPNF